MDARGANMNREYTIRDAIECGLRMLGESSSTPRLDIDLILCKIMDLDRIKLMMSYNKVMTEMEIKEFGMMVDQRMKKKPIAYIINEKEFMGLNFYVNESVLIPRPDTEIIVEEVLSIIDQISFEKGDIGSIPTKYVVGDDGLKATDTRKTVRIMDMCLGSGAIALSIGKLSDKKLEICGVDISKEAIEIAGINRKRLGVESDIKFIESDLFSNAELDFYKGKLDILVSNPPYIENAVIPTLESDVRDYEPMLALAGGEDGTDFYVSIIESAPRYLKIGGWLIFESGHDQADKIKSYMKEFGFEDIYYKQDLQGFNRMVAGRLKNIL